MSERCDVATRTVNTYTALPKSGRNLLHDHWYLSAISQEIPTDSGDKVDPKAPIRLLTFKYTDKVSSDQFRGQTDHRIYGDKDNISKQQRQSNKDLPASGGILKMEGEQKYEERAIDVASDPSQNQGNTLE